MLELDRRNISDQNQLNFCLMELKGFNRHKKKAWNYPKLESACRSMPHCEEVPVPEFNDLPDLLVGMMSFMKR